MNRTLLYTFPRSFANVPFGIYPEKRTIKTEIEREKVKKAQIKIDALNEERQSLLNENEFLKALLAQNGISIPAH